MQAFDLAEELNRTADLQATALYAEVVALGEKLKPFSQRRGSLGRGSLEAVQEPATTPATAPAEQAPDADVAADIEQAAHDLPVKVAALLALVESWKPTPLWVWIVGGLAVAGAAGGGIYLLSGTKRKRR
jgi:hypothetical protein